LLEDRDDLRILKKQRTYVYIYLLLLFLTLTQEQQRSLILFNVHFNRLTGPRITSASLGGPVKIPINMQKEDFENCLIRVHLHIYNKTRNYNVARGKTIG